jgi:hypothetical protein
MVQYLLLNMQQRRRCRVQIPPHLHRGAKGATKLSQHAAKGQVQVASFSPPAGLGGATNFSSTCSRVAEQSASPSPPEAVCRWCHKLLFNMQQSGRYRVQVSPHLQRCDDGATVFSADVRISPRQCADLSPPPCDPSMSTCGSLFAKMRIYLHHRSSRRQRSCILLRQAMWQGRIYPHLQRDAVASATISFLIHATAAVRSTTLGKTNKETCNLYCSQKGKNLCRQLTKRVRPYNDCDKME